MAPPLGLLALRDALRAEVRAAGRTAIDVVVHTDNDDDPTSVGLRALYDAVSRDTSGDRGGKLLRAPRPLGIALTREDEGDRAAKRQGLSVEWQSGDEPFDRVVYVDAPPEVTPVLPFVLGPEARGAILELLDLGVHSVDVDVGDYVEARLSRPGPAPDLAPRAVEAFTRLCDHLPRVRHDPSSRVAKPLRVPTLVLAAIGVVGWGANVGYVGIVGAGARAAFGRHDDERLELSALHFALLVAFGVVSGLAGASLYGAALRRRAKGRSDAHRLVARAQLSAFGGFSVLAFTAALFAAVAAIARQ